MKHLVRAFFLFVLIATNTFGQGTLLWDESVNGPLSNDFNNPTSFSPLSLGTNSIIGATEIVPVGNNWDTYPDIFLIQVPTNVSISAVYLQINKPNVWTGLKNPTFSTDLAFSGNSASGEILSQWGIAPIGSGLYGMYLLNNDAQSVISIANYRLDFFVQNVPEPSSVALAIVGAAVFIGYWRLNRQ